ncbi:MAG: winged helix-turn-helix transcriptional regulator [Chloroflexota bacterium]|nr:winged helix-turn-helix transcriptional regulator [Chloroflexota bacterium]
MNPTIREESYQLHAQLCKALADPKRLLIVNELRDGERSVSELVQGLGLSQTNVSQHLAVLREKRLVTARRSGTSTYYSLANPKLVRAFDLLREVMVDILAGQAERSRELTRSLVVEQSSAR